MSGSLFKIHIFFSKYQKKKYFILCNFSVRTLQYFFLNSLQIVEKTTLKSCSEFLKSTFFPYCPNGHNRRIHVSKCGLSTKCMNWGINIFHLRYIIQFAVHLIHGQNVQFKLNGNKADNKEMGFTNVVKIYKPRFVIARVGKWDNQCIVNTKMQWIACFICEIPISSILTYCEKKML